MGPERPESTEPPESTGPPESTEPPGFPDAPGLRRRWAFSLPAAVLAVCLLLGCAAAVVLLRDKGPVPVAKIELSPPATGQPTVPDGPGSPGAAPVPASPVPLPSPSPQGETAGGPVIVVVHIAGAVQRPGIVRLPPGSRIIDAVDAAGGTAADADLAAVNLAAPLEDGAMVLVPRIGEVAPPPGSTTGGTAGGGTAGGTGTAAGSGTQADDGPPVSVNLNTADSTALQTLPRVGPVLAERIIAWRTEHGSFSSPEDLDAVPGIGEAMMAALLPLVTV